MRQVLFEIPGLHVKVFGYGLMLFLAFLAALPESLRFLATVPARQMEASQVAILLRPELGAAAGLRIVPDAASDADASGRLADLFSGPLRVATPLLWLIYIASSMTVFSLSSWMPVAVESVGLSRSAAAIATALLFTGSAVGGVVGGWFADRFGIAAVIALAALAVPVVASLGTLGGTPEFLMPMCFLAGCFAFGAQTCLHGVAGSLYPTPVRANGVGWAIGIAKIGSIAGPYIAGLLLPRLSSQGLFFAAASPLIVVACLAVVLKMALSATRSNADALATNQMS